MIVQQAYPPANKLELEQMQQIRSALHDELPLDALSEELGFADEHELLRIVASGLGLGYVELSSIEISPDLLATVPSKLIHRFGVLPVMQEEDVLFVAVGNPWDVHAIDIVAATTGRRVEPVVAQRSELQRLIRSHLGVGAETIGNLVALQGGDEQLVILEELQFDNSEAAEAAQEASVVRLVNEILTEAIHARASDIHVEAQAAGIKIRYRIDGVLQRQPTPPEINRFHAAIISRLKIMAKMNIAERRLPQDGRIKLRVAGREVDIRVSVIPMLYGEGIVMRVLDKEAMSFSLRGIGMPEEVYARFQKLIRLPHGIVLVTGPTGSGKTTTLYSALAEIKNEETKIITTEDPIEYQLEGINQIQVHAKVGLTFATSLRSILRHDPDVVLVGEIRDLETAENATQASLTGHLVFSTLHTNDSSGAFMRLTDMGVEPFLVSSTVEGVMAQRLVRVLCQECREAFPPTPDEAPEDFPWHQLRLGGGRCYRAVGCRACRGTGYSGRVGLYELLVTDDEIRHLASCREPAGVIKKAAVRAGMCTLRQDGWEKVLQGITTIDEVLRVTKFD
jgi:general secretion pathway protein E/type IV pilus assembly protein PilB